MKDTHDNAIDRALEALRTAEPPQGMETRIQARMQARLNAVPPPRLRAFGWWYAGGLTALTAILLIVGVREFRAAPAPVGVRDVQVAEKKGPAPPLIGVGLQAQEQNRQSKGGPEPGSCSEAAQKPLSFAFARPRPAHMQSRAALVSFPAPAEPLTEQEKLLQQVARRGDLEDFDLLNPETVELAMARDKADFDSFLMTASRNSQP